jgi:RNA polymerase sigma factor (sigma-70 family)
MPHSTVAEIFTAYRGRIGNFIRKRVPLLEDAEDILQDVFYQLTRIDGAQPVEQTAAWLYRVARNAIINFKNKKRAIQLPVYYDEDEDEWLFKDIADIVFGSESTPETVYLRELVFEEIEAALAELPKQQREVFEQTEFLGVSVREIAEKTKTPVNTVLSRKHYAVLHLRKRLKDLYNDIVG